MARLYWRDVALAMGCFLAISYVFCVTYDLVFEQRMYEAWRALIPGFTWLTWLSFFRGLVASFAYGLYFGLVFTPLYNYFSSRSLQAAGAEPAVNSKRAARR